MNQQIPVMIHITSSWGSVSCNEKHSNWYNGHYVYGLIMTESQWRSLSSLRAHLQAILALRFNLKTSQQTKNPRGNCTVCYEK